MSKLLAMTAMTEGLSLIADRPRKEEAHRLPKRASTTPAEDVWAPIDPLGEALHFLRMSGVFYCRSELRAPWSLGLPALDHCLMFHFVTLGECRLEVPAAKPLLLRRGTLALVPHGAGHVLSSGVGLNPTPLFDTQRKRLSERYEVLQLGGDGELTHLICGAVRFDHPAAIQLVSQLPKVINVDSARSRDEAWLHSTLDLMETESKELRPGGETVVTRLADVLVIQAIRAWLASDSGSQAGWLAAVEDKHIGRAIALIHRLPAQDLSLEKLAAAAAMSRSAFAARFADLVGVPPMQYLARWRMQLALSLLQHSNDPLATIADQIGYQSEAAFSRAFKRLFGESPGATRRASRETAPMAVRQI